MRISVDIKPSVYKARTKDQLLDKIRKYSTHIYTSGGSRYSLDYSGYVNKKSNTIRVYNLHKVRRKTSEISAKTGRKLKKRRVINEGYWIAYVYDYNLDLLKLSGYKEIRQNRRNYILK